MRTVLVVTLLSAGCSGSPHPPATDPPPPAPAPTAPPVASSTPKTDPTHCGALDCRTFESPQAAFQTVLAASPLVLGIGEAHAQRGTEHVPSTTHRFTHDLLPLLKGRASDIVVELLLPSGKCKEKEKQVQKQQEPVTEPQAKENQNEYVKLGIAARKQGVIPDVLRPSCEDLTRITEAGNQDISVMLETIAKLSENKMKSLLLANTRDGREAIVVGYGGALHNDLNPSEAKAAWSYGPALAQVTKGRYVELDLIVPEYIKDTDTWKALPWYPHYDRAKLGDKSVLFRVVPNSFVLVFPLTAKS